MTVRANIHVVNEVKLCSGIYSCYNWTDSRTNFLQAKKKKKKEKKGGGVKQVHSKVGQRSDL